LDASVGQGCEVGRYGGGDDAVVLVDGVGGEGEGELGGWHVVTSWKTENPKRRTVKKELLELPVVAVSRFVT
jgi:hypothetical protein